MEWVEYGYCRISTKRQSLERQERNIKESYTKAYIVKEIYTGARLIGRREWEKLLTLVARDLQRGKKVRIIFDSVSRMSRDEAEGCEVYEELYRKGVELIFLKEPHINTEVYRAAAQRQIDIYVSTGNAATDKLLNTIIEALNAFVIDLAKEQIRLAFAQAEKELQDLHQRTSEGLMTAKLNGKQIGRVTGRKYETQKAKQAKELILKRSIDFGGQNTNEELMKITGISRNTLYRYKRELRESMKGEGI